ncbi:helix-turn-helix transcriptional regulator [Natrialbaceae archaeon A-CW1-1]
MRFPRAISVALIILLIAATAGAAAMASPSAITDRTAEQSTLQSAEPTDLEPADPAQVIRITLSADDNATWTIESRFILEDEDDEEAFEAFAESVVNGERDAGHDPEMYAHFVEEASAATDREMSMADAGYDDPRIERIESDNETAEFGVDEGTAVGVIAYSFTWENFTTSGNNQIFVGDAFQSTDGTWFPELAHGQQLVIDTPENYAFQSSPVATRDGALVWDGPHEFREGERELELLRGASPPENGDDTPPPGVDDPETSMLPLLGALGALLVAVALVAAYVLTRSSPPAWLPASVRSRLETDEPPAGDQPVGGRADPSDAPRDPPPMEPSPAAGATGAAADDIDPELLSDEERVLRLLRGSGGRMKQASIVKETGWSNAKVSQLLSKMDEDDEIEKLRIGRENLITLPHVDLTEIE